MREKNPYNISWATPEKPSPCICASRLVGGIWWQDRDSVLWILPDYGGVTNKRFEKQTRDPSRSIYTLPSRQHYTNLILYSKKDI